MTTKETKTDKVAKSMGELLLRGYKMLAVSCDACNNVLLEDKQGGIICINCNNEEDERKNSKGSEPVKLVVSNSQKQNTSENVMENKPYGVENTVLDLDRTSRIRIADSVQELLVNEIMSSSIHLQNLSPGTDMQQKQIYIRHIRECAQTIDAIRNIRHVF